MRILVVEDNPERVKKFKRELVGNIVDYAVDASAGLEYLVSNSYGLIFLDHDLGLREMVNSDDANTGYQVALAIASDAKNTSVIVVHSCNPAGASNISRALPRAILAPFPVLNIAAAVTLAEQDQVR